MNETLISDKARIGSGVTFGRFTRVFDNVEIGDNVTIGEFCVIGQPAGGSFSGQPLVIGEGSTIRSHALLYEASTFGPNLETGHHTLIREGTHAGVNLRVGSHADIEGDCTIGDYTRLHSYAHVGRGSRIGSFVWLYSLTTLTNDPLPPSDVEAPVVVEDGVVVCVGATVLPGTVLREGAWVTAGSRVSGDVPPGAVIDGHDGRIASHVTLLAHLPSGTRHPWMHHFAENYPEAAQGRIADLLARIEAQDRTGF
jgi:UDP-3-O-[3-hydroxymyristoyl] glucosamine N-acyltransferase